MIRYIINRILLLIPVILAVSLIVFTLIELAPGTYVDYIVDGEMTVEDVIALRERYNLHRSMFYRYGLYMLNLIQGDLGVSFSTGLNVFDMYMERLPNTLILTLSGLIIGTAISIPLGIRAARKAGTITDAATTTFALVGMSMPSFWLGLLLMLLFSLRLEILPAAGNTDGFRSLIMPAVCSAMVLMATSTRQTRSSMLEVLRADFLRTARAKGVPEKTVIRKHALGNALIPIVTALGASVCVSLAGSAVIEQVFAWPGVGRMLVDGIFTRDVPTILGCCVMTTILYVVVMLTVDLLYAFIDPRIRSQYVRKRRKRTNVGAASSESGAPIGIVAALAGPEHAEAVDAAQQSVGDAYEASEAKSLQADSISQEAAESDQAAAPISNVRSFATRRDDEIAADEKTMDAAEVIAKYKKRSQMGEIIHRLVHNKSSLAGLIILSIVVLIALYSLTMTYDSVVRLNIPARLSPPSWEFPFGTDNMGRNAFLRVLYGSRYSLIIGFSAVAFSALFGVTMGVLAGYYGGLIDNIIMRVSDVLASLPGLLLGMVIMVMLGFKMQNLIVAVGVAGIPHFVRMSRASILTVKGNEFVEAARAIGFSDLRIIATQVLPNGLSPILVQATALLGLNIIFAASLSYLGFGIPPPTPEWGGLVAAGREFARLQPWLMAFPGLAIMITVLGFNLLGDGLRDALDPKLKK